MRKTEKTMIKKHKCFKLDSKLNDRLPISSASPCERKCIKCDVSSKDCKYS